VTYGLWSAVVLGAATGAGSAPASADEALAACGIAVEQAVAVRFDAEERLFRAADGTRYRASELRTPVTSQAGRTGQTAVAAGADAEFLAVSVGPPDRWNRVPSWILRRRAGALHLWQVDRLESGTAFFAPLHADGDCADVLRQAEGRARHESAGIWRDGGTGVAYRTARPGSFQGAEGRYVIARGRIVSLGKTRSTRYLNFGRYWKTDVTGTLKVSDEDKFNVALGRSGFKLDDLAGRFVEMRGVVEDRDGPHIALRHPEQLVILDYKRAARDGQGNN